MPCNSKSETIKKLCFSKKYCFMLNRHQTFNSFIIFLKFLSVLHFYIVLKLMKMHQSSAMHVLFLLANIRSFFNKIQNIVSKRFLLLNVYANGQTYGQSGAWHLDSDSAEDYTFLYYANCNWKTTWGGETVFKFDDTIKYFLPKPNTALLFPATIWHYAKSPSRDFCDLRTTLAFKLRELK